jgi:2-pyrone-4,6-dicarboxylate lactonase
VALVAPAVSEAELKKLDAQGFRGARFHFMKHLGRAAGIEEILALGKRLAAIGWHLQIHLESTLIAEMAGALKRSPVPIVIDHMGRIDASLGPHQKPFRDLVELLKNPNVWVKVSGSERASRQPSPWRDAVPFAKRLVAEFGDRTLWGTDWPHPNLKEAPDDGVLVDLLSEIAPSEAQRKALLVDNPQRFYGFSS